MPDQSTFPPTPLVSFDGFRAVTITCSYSDGSTVTATEALFIEDVQMAPDCACCAWVGTITVICREQ